MKNIAAVVCVAAGADAVIVTSSTAANYYTYPTGQGIAIKYLR
jgi:hypothetical protein